MSTVLVTGANRGLGLEFCRQYAQFGWQVIACSRQPQTSDKLAELGEHLIQFIFTSLTWKISLK